jgi:hypothetical protein
VTHAQYLRYVDGVRTVRGDAHLADRSDPTTLSAATWGTRPDGTESRTRFVLSWSPVHDDALYQEVRDDRWHHEDDFEVVVELTGVRAVIEWEDVCDLDVLGQIGLDILLEQ